MTILTLEEIQEIKKFYRGEIELSDGFSEPAGQALKWRKFPNSGMKRLQGRRKVVKDIQALVATLEAKGDQPCPPLNS